MDAQIRHLIFQALEPAALEISLQVGEDLEAERARHRAHWQQRLERAAYEAQRAERQYQAAEPENRLVVRTLERQWEEALQAEAKLKADYERFLSTEPSPLTVDERERIRFLAADIPALWQAPTTTDAERQAIVRQLIERVIITVVDDSEQVTVEVHWAGGHCTRTRIIRPVARLEQLSYYPELLARVAALYEQGVACRDIAQALNAEGWRPAKRRATFNAPMVSNLLARQGLRSGSPKQRHSADLSHAPDEWLLTDLAFELDMPSVTLFSWIRRGWVRARKVNQSGRSLWLIWADSAECERLRARREAPQRWSRHVRVDDAPQSSN